MKTTDTVLKWHLCCRQVEVAEPLTRNRLNVRLNWTFRSCNITALVRRLLTDVHTDVHLNAWTTYIHYEYSNLTKQDDLNVSFSPSVYWPAGIYLWICKYTIWPKVYGHPSLYDCLHLCWSCFHSLRSCLQIEIQIEIQTTPKLTGKVVITYISEATDQHTFSKKIVIKITWLKVYRYLKIWS